MDFLIIGGLLVIGVGALVALFFVLRGGNTPTTKRPEAVPQTAKEVPPIPAYEPVQQQEHPVSIPTQQQAAVPDASETRTVPVVESTETNAHSVYEKEQQLKVRLNGQFHELANGLRSLQQQAIEMEHRLGSLNQMIENIERDQPKEK
ncbi:MAG: hypothetical protein NVSMB49_15950 [Ktedonobacteraceae bacterium]